MTFVSAVQLQELVSIEDAITSVRAAFVRVTDGTAEQLPRLAFGDGHALAMMARGSPTSGTVAKFISVRPENRASGLPTIHAVVVWFDAQSGAPTLILDGASVTSLRTGAASAVATEVMAAPEAAVLAMIGAGRQALDQVRAVCAVRNITDVRLVSRTGVSARAQAELLRHDRPSLSVSVSNSVAEAVEGADIICSATDSRIPIIPLRALAERVHINAVGSHRPTMRELPDSVLRRASLIAVDDRNAAMAEAGEIIHGIASGAIGKGALHEIGHLVTDPPEPQGITVFKSVGVPIQDWAIAELVSERLSALPRDDALDYPPHESG